ncbi:pseudouridine synthase [Oribacterium sp. oral taxon 108]|uniref:pseudouridine synthase n=1 Tax=Oribacterium sp. oral taxon 108 TaxID=712414 RepID=UPI00020DD9B0|nr:pseudouridine synthase [Oribacterium sp. oral taxon 108]EGL38362.1 putative 16S pseudouridylate 516 synthase [Oribacterium sp. oral taxon 108 str. F0425]
MRLDKYLSDMGLASRSDIKKEIRKGLVLVNGEIIRDSSFSVPLHASVSYRGEEVCYEEFSYYMMNKPIGVLSSTEDRKQKTVLDLITEKHRKDLFPVGRLDKDSEGLILIMNDGQLAHTLLSPKNHIEKRYYIEIPVLLEDSDIAPLRFGIQYDKDLIAEPAKVRILSAEKEKTAIEIIITEGKFHQIKKMFLALSENYVVTKLKRLSMGKVVLDENLAPGDYRRLSTEEIEALQRALE